MKNVLVALVLAAALLFGLGAAGLAYAEPKQRPGAFQQLERPEQVVTVWVGTYCVRGTMKVATSHAELAKYDCRARYRGILTEEQVRGMGVR